MFDKEKFVTRGVANKIPPLLQLGLWQLISAMPEPKDYLQVFRLSTDGKALHIAHTQEQPKYSRNIDLKLSREGIDLSAKVFVIDDGDHSTMLLSDEY